jgi:hypothetical protein
VVAAGFWGGSGLDGDGRLSFELMVVCLCRSFYSLDDLL